MDPLEAVRQRVDAMLFQQPDVEERRCGFVHLYGVAQAATILALRRGLDVNLAACAGMLHDIATYQTADPTDHACRSALMAEHILAQAEGFSPVDTEAICDAIACHSDKAATHSALAELLKDADALQHHLYNVALPPQTHEADRLARAMAELGLA